MIFIISKDNLVFWVSFAMQRRKGRRRKKEETNNKWNRDWGSRIGEEVFLPRTTRTQRTHHEPLPRYLLEILLVSWDLKVKKWFSNSKFVLVRGKNSFMLLS